MRYAASAALAAALALSAGAPAQAAVEHKGKPGGTAPAESLSSRDKHFIEKAARDGMAEVALAQLAKEHGLGEPVKSFASRMDRDHSDANRDLAALAAAKGVAIPNDIDKKDQEEIDKLRKQMGPDFDRAYMSHMVKDHKKDVDAFRHEAKHGKDADVRNFAASKLPTLEDHLRMAESTRDVTLGTKRTGDRETGSNKP
ncbi:MAG TPA: DUF4142 domain-containing protein [Usitatibacter sp.]|jgi:putative membrane protein|nr:DUF4142 domain-containing protein [Usitatibacter sp.]